MLYRHQDHLINLAEIEVALTGRDSARLLMTNGDAINFLAGAEALIAVLHTLRPLESGGKLIFPANISKVKFTGSMALIQMKSGYQETFRGEDAVRHILAAAVAVPIGGVAPGAKAAARLGRKRLGEDGDE